jgi:hypothetical protein
MIGNEFLIVFFFLIFKFLNLVENLIKMFSSKSVIVVCI